MTTALQPGRDRSRRARVSSRVRNTNTFFLSTPEDRRDEGAAAGRENQLVK